MARLLLLPLFLAVLAFGSMTVPNEPVSAGGGGCHRIPDEREATGDTVLLQASCFTPVLLRVEPGTKVRFQNFDTMDHYIQGVAMSWGTLDGPMKGESAAAYEFAQPGTYPYSCNLHFGMTGVIVVGDGSFVAARPDVRAVSSKGEPLTARVASNDPGSVPAEAPRTAAVEAKASGSNSLLLVAMGTLAGGTAVAIAFAARSVRRS